MILISKSQMLKGVDFKSLKKVFSQSTQQKISLSQLIFLLLDLNILLISSISKLLENLIMLSFSQLMMVILYLVIITWKLQHKSIQHICMDLDRDLILDFGLEMVNGLFSTEIEDK
jgi:hypothetical protein